MILDKNKNLFFEKAEDGNYRVCIAMNDGTRNYLHTELTYFLPHALAIIDELDGMDLDSKYRGNAHEIIEDGSYFRLNVVIQSGNGDEPYNFHSRKLNAFDALQERNWLIGETPNKNKA